jgi:hypothetical protein
MATVALFLRPTYVGSVTMIHSSDETSDTPFKRVKPGFSVC